MLKTLFLVLHRPTMSSIELNYEEERGGKINSTLLFLATTAELAETELGRMHTPLSPTHHIFCPAQRPWLCGVQI